MSEIILLNPPKVKCESREKFIDSLMSEFTKKKPYTEKEWNKLKNELVAGLKNGTIKIKLL